MASGTLPTSDPRSDPDRPRRQRQGTVVLGLVLSLAGFFIVAIALPVGSDAIVRVLPAAGLGILCLWIGGVLMGLGSGRRAARRDR